MNSALRHKILPFLVLTVGIMSVSSGSIFVRLADAHPFVKGAYRMGIASLIIAPFALLFYRGEYRRLTKRDAGLTLLAGAFLALHFATWITSLDYTSVASSVVLVDTIPIWVALINMVFGSQRPSRAMWFCVLLSFAGAALVAYSDSSSSSSGSGLWGDFLAVAGGMAAAAYIALGGEARKKLSVVPYAALCYSTAGVLLWALSLGMGLRISGFTNVTWGALAGIAVFAQVIGHSSYNWALGSFSTGFIAIALLGEPLGAAIIAYFLFGEVPAPVALVGMAMIITSIVMAARNEK
jgi:drug/metabolite transporter (DMT)-like permease